MKRNDCIAIATYTGVEAWLKHATAMDTHKDNISQLAKEVKRNAKGGKVYIASTKPQDGLVGELNGLGVLCTVYMTNMLAINARTGEVKSQFNTSELPK